MQATNKSDATQVYEGAERVTRIGIKDFFKYILKPFSKFSYHYFVEGIKAVQKDGPTKELEKITNLSYDETIKIMEKCQKDGIRVVASERNLTSKDSEFGKQKSLFQQKRITRYDRRIKMMSNFKFHFPNIARIVHINDFIKKNEQKQNKQIETHKDKRYNIYFNKAKQGYMGDRIADLIEYRTKISKDLFDTNTQEAIENIKEDGMTLNAQQLKDLSEKLQLHEIGEVGVEEFKKDYCIHSMPFAAFMRIENELEVSGIPYGMKVVSNEENEKIANVYLENKHLERYAELGFNSIGQMRVYGSNKKNMQWNINSKDEIMSFKTKTGDEEKQMYAKLSGKDYIMQRQENECIWTVLKNDIKEIADEEKKRNVVDEDLKKHNILEGKTNEMEKSNKDSQEKTIDVKLNEEKEVGE